MQEKPKNIPLDMNYWSEIINNWNRKNESKKKYCERLGINLNTFTYVQIKLQQKMQPKPQIHFASLNVTNSNQYHPKTLEKIIFENARGDKIYLPTTLPSEELTKLIKLLGCSDA